MNKSQQTPLVPVYHDCIVISRNATVIIAYFTKSLRYHFFFAQKIGKATFGLFPIRLSDQEYAYSEKNEYLFSDSPTGVMNFEFNTNSNLMTGTYKLVFKLYDNDEFIGEEYEYIIIK